MLTLAVKPQWVRYKLDETIEKPCSDFPSTHLGSVKGYSVRTTDIRLRRIITTHGKSVQPLQSVKLS